MTQSEDFAKAIAFAWWPIFKMFSFLEYLVFFFERLFAENNSKWFVEWILTCLLDFYFLTQSEDFAKAIVFGWWPSLKMLSFREYLVFFRAVFLHRTNLNDLYNGFWHAFWNFNFWPKVKILERLKPLHHGWVSKCSHFSNI